MRKSLLGITIAAAALGSSALLLPAFAQSTATPAGQPGAQIVSRVAAGTYAIDEWHSQVVWSVNHMGFNYLNGIFGNPTGTLTLDPAHRRHEILALSGPSTEGKPIDIAAHRGKSPLIRTFGINTLPTVWLIDHAGKLRSLSALENTTGQLKQLLGRYLLFAPQIAERQKLVFQVVQ